MRFRSALLAALVFAACAIAHAAPEATRTEMLQRLQAQVPGVSVPDLAQGAAAFDAELRAQAESHKAEVDAAAAVGKARWVRRFKAASRSPAASPTGAVAWRRPTRCSIRG